MLDYKELFEEKAEMCTFLLGQLRRVACVAMDGSTEKRIAEIGILVATDQLDIPPRNKWWPQLPHDTSV